MDQDHREYLEGQASDQLEREEYAHERREVDMRVGGDGWKLTRGIDGGYLIEVEGWLDERQVQGLANTLLSEIEMDQRGDSGPWDDDPDYPSWDWRQEVASDSTRRGYAQWVAAQREDDELNGRG